MIEHQIIKFISAETAMVMILNKKETEFKTANPPPQHPGEKAPDKDKEAFQLECDRISNKVADELEKAMAAVRIVEEEGHPDLPDNHVVRSETDNRCRFVGCGNITPKSGARNGGTKAGRHARAFCRAHSFLRRQIPRKKGYFVLRTDLSAGISVA